MFASTSMVRGWISTRNSSLRVAPFNIVSVSTAVNGVLAEPE